ncbi:membrane metallo-endopeptidase-like 1 [Dermacentor andersoni]|uniref:membrane metallo-endopeptidase-like 1 n=1 Tax=Dermacentor andersoni TaxID=34620 RepID=UPI0024162B61|nr:membrane metallo-endopeptidase-like 1 [Dermacentor andersoni]
MTPNRKRVPFYCRYRIENQLDKSLNPCDDFADYVCRRWTTRQKLLLSRSEMWDMLLSWLYNLPERLNTGFSRFPIAKKVIAMFNACNKQGGSQIHITKEFMRARGIVWPEKAEEAVSPEKALFDLSVNWNVHLWFTLKIFPFISKETPRLIFVEPNELMRWLKAVFSQIPKQTFQRVYKELFRVFSNDTSSEPEPEDILKTYGVLERVFNILVPSRRYKPGITKLLSLSDMDYNSSFPIGSHLMNVLNSVAAFDPPISLNDLVIMKESSNIGKIFDMITDFGNEVVLRHLSWLFVLEYGALAHPAAVLFILRGSGNRARQALPRYCACQVESSYKLLVAAMASVGLFSEQERRRIDEHLAAIVEEAANKTWAVSWLDNDTKKIAVAKLKSVRTVLWPSDKFLTPEALDEVYANFTYSASSFAEYWIETRRSQRLMFGSQAAEEEMFLDDSTMLPYVHYKHVLNHLTLSMGALAPPLYCKDGTNAMFYGGLLYAYARELMTAIDSDGVRFNPKGEFVTSWLSYGIQDTFEKRTLRCLPGNISIFPDVPAMEVAYAAFKRHHHENNSRLSEELTEEKVFFITTCLPSCSSTPADNIYGGDCNKAVMNFAPFAEAFGCPAGSKMNPASKCPFYD